MIWSGLLTLSTPSLLSAQAAGPRVALVVDRDTPAVRRAVSVFQEELNGFFRPGEVVLLPLVAGDGTADGVGAAVRRVLGDTSAAVVVALGPLASHVVARSGTLPRPAVAAVVLDAAWQGLPVRDGATGVPNLVYVDQSLPVGTTLADFHGLIPFRRLAVVLDADLAAALPRVAQGAAEAARATGAEVVIIRAGAGAQDVLSAIPSGVDAVYLTPLPAMPDGELTVLLQALAGRRLPVLSYGVDREVRSGALASFEPAENWRRLARRVAVNLQRILAGEDAGRLPVRLVSLPRLTINLETARRIGFSPSWTLRTDAELVGTEGAGPTDTLTLAQTMRGAVEANLDYAAARLEAESGRQDVRRARAGLLPQLDSRLGGTLTREEVAAASLGREPERRFEGGLTMSVPIYSERAWAGYGSEQRLQVGRDARRDQVRLEVVLDAASAYLRVWTARTHADTRRTNLHRTRTNLEVARMREGAGTTSRADVYRWEGEVANARRDLIAAEAQVRVASLELCRLLNRPLASALAQQPVTLSDPALLGRDSTVLRRLENPGGLAALTATLVAEAVRHSPELVQAEAAIAATRRTYTAAGRAFWLPTFSLEGGLANVFSRGGAGSAAPVFPVPGVVSRGPDLSWQFRVQATLPLYTAGARGAAREQSRLEIERLTARRDAARQAVEQRVRAALEQAAASQAAIVLARDAAVSANRNYELVSDAYAHGTASITALIDAQSAATSASEAAANAIHHFLLDLVLVERAMGTYTVLQSPDQRQAFLTRLTTHLETP